MHSKLQSLEYVKKETSVALTVWEAQLQHFIVHKC